MGDFSKLIVWQKSLSLAVAIYQVAALFPDSERYGLSSQMRRAAISVSSNIAEGAGRGAEKSFYSFLRIARGSLHEVRSQLHVATALGYATGAQTAAVHSLAEEVSRMLSGMLRADSKR